MKKRNTFSLIKGMLSLVKGYGYLILFAVIVGSLGFIAAMGITFFAGLAIFKFIQEIVMSGSSSITLSYGWLIALTLICGFSRGGLRYAEQYLNHYMAFTLLAVVRDRVFGALRKQGSKVLDDKNKGDILSILQSDTETLEVFYAHTITPFLIALIVETIVLIVLGLLCGWIFALIALCAFMFIGGLVPLIFYLSNKKLGVEYRKELASSENLYLNSIYGIREIVTFNHQKDIKEEIINNSHKLNIISKNLNDKATTSASAVNLLIVIADIAIIGVGALLLSNGFVISPVLVLGYAIIAASFGPVVALANLPGNLTMSFASARRILDLIDTKPSAIEGNKEFDFKSLEVKNLSFGYDDKTILKNINLTLKKGQIIGIHGRSGSGKSTLLKLLLNFETPKDGEVLYNDKNVQEYSRESLSKNVILFSQSTYLFQGTLEYNLKIAKPSATEEELRIACEKAGILEYIDKTEKGFQTEVSALQDNLSSGEKQRMGLARVFLTSAPVLLFDEATSNVDAYNEALILKQLIKAKNDKAIIVISHRKSTLSICDKVYELEGGTLCSD